MNGLPDHQVFSIFEQISTIPRESGNEKSISDWIKEWAEELDLSVTQDEIHNLVISKPGSPGYEDHPPVLLQAHIDMVCEKTTDSLHDFTRDPITFKIDGDWLSSAAGTSLGADNGIGVACAMAILDDPKMKHPPLEVVFTVQEETTFAGADRIDVSNLKSRRMINLDHACDRELIVGSCGGVGVEFTMPISYASEIPIDHQAFRIVISGLLGGHSGEDIHRGRGNAIEYILHILEHLSLPVVRMTGGTNRLAIPREAEAVVLTLDPELLRSEIKSIENGMRKVLGDSTPDLSIDIYPTDAGLPLKSESFSAIASVVRLYPNGIVDMDPNFEGVVESSDNIGIVSTEKDHFRLVSEVRAGHQNAVDSILRTIDLIANIFGAKVNRFSRYTPWEYVADSEFRKLAARVYKELFGEDIRQLAVHAGLECGFFAKKMPGLDIISIGPNCENFHSPQERVSISSTERFYGFLSALLSRL